MSDYINRQAAIDALADYIRNVNKVMGIGMLSAYDCEDAARSVLDELPSADVPDRNVGKWHCSDDMYEYGICSVCGWDSGEAWSNAKKWFNFCPNCGSRMK